MLCTYIDKFDTDKCHIISKSAVAQIKESLVNYIESDLLDEKHVFEDILFYKYGWIRLLYKICNISHDKVYLNLFKIPMLLDIFEDIYNVCSFQFRSSSI